MAWTQDSYLKTQENIYKPQLDSQLNTKLQALKKAKDAQLSDLNQQRDLQLPTYLEGQNSVDARAAQNLQRLRENMANSGLYRSGSMVSDTAMIGNQANTDIAKIGRDREQFLGDIANKIGRANTDYTDNERLANDEYANLLRSEQAKALAGWNTIDEQQKQAARAYAVSRARGSGYGGGGGRQPSATEMQRMGYGGAYSSVDDAIKSGKSLHEIMAGIYGQAGELAQYGVDPDKVVAYAQNRYRYWGNSYSESPEYADGAYTRAMGGFVPE